MISYQSSQNVSGIQFSRGNSGGNSGGGSPRKVVQNSSSIYNSQVKVHTGYYQNFKGLIKEDCKTVIATRKKNGSKSIHAASKKDVADTNCQISELSSTLTKMKIFIAAFSGKPQGTNYNESSIGQEALVSVDTCNSFIVRAYKRTKA